MLAMIVLFCCKVIHVHVPPSVQIDCIQHVQIICFIHVVDWICTCAISVRIVFRETRIEFVTLSVSNSMLCPR